MSIEVVPQQRVDHLVTAVDGRTLRRTDHRGIAWFGGRQAPKSDGVVTVRHQWAGIVSPFWLPDTLAYRTDMVRDAIVTIAAAVIFVPDTCALADISAVSYDVTVLAPPEAVVEVPAAR